MRQTLVAAHTGCGIHPDNTLASFEEGIATGADIVEVDVHVCKDGTAILLHDDSPYLLMHSYGELNDPQIRRLLGAAYDDHPIATLEQALSVSADRGTKLNLDMKSPDAIAPTVRLIRRYNAQSRVFITGCSDAMTKLYPDIRVMMNTPDELSMRQYGEYAAHAESVCREAKREGYAGLNMNGMTCLPPIVQAAHAEGLLVWVYTINDRQPMEWFIRMGVDAITTRAPETLLSLVGKL